MHLRTRKIKDEHTQINWSVLSTHQYLSALVMLEDAWYTIEHNIINIWAHYSVGKTLDYLKKRMAGLGHLGRAGVRREEGK